jgi:lipoate-protein ligase A
MASEFCGMNIPAESGVFKGAACDAAAAALAAGCNYSTTIVCFYDPPARGTWNMALDEALLHQAVVEGLPTLRFYEWGEPTLSLGYFQSYAHRQRHAASLDCPAVRRTTGGGAILHDRELTYSCSLPSTHWLARRAQDLYYAIHESIVAVLAQYGVVAHLYDCGRGAPRALARSSKVGCDCGPTQQAQEPFLCFQRRTAGDVILSGRKVVGSAQRRCRGAVLQHGSIILARSACAPELPGIHDVVSCRFQSHDFAERMRGALSERLQFDFVSTRPAQKTLDRAAAIEVSKFAAGSWQQMR